MKRNLLIENIIVFVYCSFLLTIFVFSCNNEHQNLYTNDHSSNNNNNSLNNKKLQLLLEHLTDTQIEARILAVKKLGKMNSPEVIEPLIHSLKIDKNPVKIVAAEELGKFHNEKVIEALIDAMTFSDRKVWNAVMKSLLLIGPKIEAPLLISINSANENIKLKSAIILGKMHSGKALEPLQTMLFDGNSLEKSVAIYALVIIGEKGFQFVAEQFNNSQKNDIVKFSALALAKYPPKSKNFFINAIKNGDVLRKTYAIEGIRIIGDKRFEKILFPLLLSKQRQIRLNTVIALGDISSREGIKYLKPLLKDPDTIVSKLASFSIEKIKKRY